MNAIVATASTRLFPAAGRPPGACSSTLPQPRTVVGRQVDREPHLLLPADSVYGITYEQRAPQNLLHWQTTNMPKNSKSKPGVAVPPATKVPPAATVPVEHNQPMRSTPS